MHKVWTQISIAILVLTFSGCSKSLEGQTFVSLDRSDWIEFISEDRLETPVGSSVVEGEYRIESDGRLRISVNSMGGNQIGYATFNDDGGFTATFSENTRERYFKEDDPKLSKALEPAETFVTTSAHYCRDGRCMGILPPVREVIVSNVNVTYDGKLTVPFSKISELELVDANRTPAYGVAARVSGDSLRNSMHGGWTEFRFSDKGERDDFYNVLGEAVSKWHSEYGVPGFAFAPVKSAEKVPDLAEQSEQLSNLGNAKKEMSNQSILGEWIDERAPEEILFFEEGGVFGIREGGDIELAGKYQILDDQYVLMDFDPEDQSDAQRIRYQIKDETLILTFDNGMELGRYPRAKP